MNTDNLWNEFLDKIKESIFEVIEEIKKNFFLAAV